MTTPSALFERLPPGHCVVEYDGRRRESPGPHRSGTAGQKILAEEVGGPGLASANLYLLGGEQRLRPSELAAEVVVDLLGSLRVLPPSAVSSS